MSREFHRFYDLVMSEGLLGASSPHVGDRFRRITDNFLRLHKQAGDTTGYISPEDERTTIAGDGLGVQPTASSSSSAGVRSPAVADNMSGAASHTGTAAPPVTTMTTSAPQQSAPLSYEVVAQATPDNATFPFYSSFDTQNLGSFMPAADPAYTTLPLSASYAFHEQTIGRRLQRRTTERGLLLASMANPPPERYAAVFGFSLLFESREDIVKRLAAQLSNMEMPFQTQQNQPLKPKEQRIEHKIRLTFGHEKEFLNADEVELYLARLGIHVPQQAEYVEAEVDMNALSEVEFTAQLTPPVQNPSGSMTMHGGYVEVMASPGGSSMGHPNMQLQITGGHENNAASFNAYGMQGMWNASGWSKAKLAISIGVLVEGKISNYLIA